MVRLAIWCKKSTLAPNKWESYVREPCMSGVSMMPGHTAMTRMPKRARSRACRCHSSVRAHYTPSAVTASGTHAHTHAHTHTHTHMHGWREGTRNINTPREASCRSQRLYSLSRQPDPARQKTSKFEMRECSGEHSRPFGLRFRRR